MSDLVIRARGFQRFDGDCTCLSLIHEMADKIEALEGELAKAQQAHCEAAGDIAKMRGECERYKQEANSAKHDYGIANEAFETASRRLIACRKKFEKVRMDVPDVSPLEENRFRSALRHVQTEMAIAVSAFDAVKKGVDEALNDEGGPPRDLRVNTPTPREQLSQAVATTVAEAFKDFRIIAHTTRGRSSDEDA